MRKKKEKKKKKPKRFYSTFEVGGICGVYPSTVINWINDGKIKAGCTPGGHRRIIKSDLVVFLRKLGYPPLESLRRK